MDDTRENQVMPVTGREGTRPVLLSVICIFSMVYFALLSVLFFFFLFFAGTVTRVRNLYIPEDTWSGNKLAFIFTAGLLLRLAGLAGSIFVWKMRKPGIYLLITSGLTLAFFQFLLPNLTLGAAIPDLVLPFLAALFFRKLH